MYIEFLKEFKIEMFHIWGYTQDNMDEFIGKLRLLVPPTLFLLSFYLLNNGLLDETLAYLGRFGGSQTLVTLLGGVVLLLTLGFLISSLGAFFINFFGWSVNNRSDFFWSLNKRIRNISEQEYVQWDNVEGENNAYIRGQIDKRWQMFVINFNVLVALFLSFAISFVSLNSLPLLLFAIIFFCGFNAYYAHRSINVLNEQAKNKKVVKSSEVEPLCKGHIE